MNMVVTKQFIDSVEQASKALREKACNIEEESVAKEDSTCGRVVRAGIEDYKLQSDMLDGWTIRARTIIGYSKES